MPEHDGTLASSDLAVDAQLGEISQRYRFILALTPTNADQVRDDFLDGRLHEPKFEYRELTFSPAELGRELATIDVHQVQDTTVGTLLRAKQREVELQLEMLAAIDSPAFLPLSIELFGGITPSLREHASSILDAVATPERKESTLNAAEFLALANEELDRYRAEAPGIEVTAQLRDDVIGVMVSGSSLLIGSDFTVTRRRANALIQHEVGTHLVTQINGAGQQLSSLGSGLAGYDETQEGFAVLAEIACAGLTTGRLRQLAGRVLTAHRRVEGAGFVESFRALVDDGFSPRIAFTTTMRAYRAGGMTKDAIYLRGLVELLEHLRSGGSLDLLWRGKFALEDLPLIEDLDKRGILGPARVRPHYLEDPQSMTRLHDAAHASTLSALTRGAE